MLSKFFSSSVIKKLFMSITGFGLFGFLIMHLAGNANLYMQGGIHINRYAEKLAGFGALLEVAEWGLFAFFAIHIITALQLKFRSVRARSSGYAMQASKKGPSKNNWMSRNMAVTGILLLLFLIIHVRQFQYGPGMAEGYVTDIDGHQGRDLYRLVVETFKNPLYVGFYCFSILILTMHLLHGFWSAFQSSTLSSERTTKLLYRLGLLFALVLGAGFFFIPLWIYFHASGALA